MILSQCICVYIYTHICFQCIFPISWGKEGNKRGEGEKPKHEIPLITKLCLCKVIRRQGFFTEVSFTDILNVCFLNFKMIYLVSIHSSA